MFSSTLSVNHAPRRRSTLSDLRVPVLSIVCEPCGLRERYDVVRLQAQYGWDAKLTDLLWSREAPSPFPRLISRAGSQVWISSMRQSSTSDRSDRLAGPLSESAELSRYSGRRFAGPYLRGCFLPGGADRQLVDRDGVVRLHALYEMETDDGFCHHSPQSRSARGIRRTLTYARSHVELWAPDGPYAWLSRRIFIGTLCSLDPRPQVLIRVSQVG